MDFYFYFSFFLKSNIKQLEIGGRKILLVWNNTSIILVQKQKSITLKKR